MLDKLGYYLDKKGNLCPIGSAPLENGFKITESETFKAVEMSESDSRLLAIQIEMIKKVLREIDLDYLATSIDELKKMANRYDSSAVLNRNYRPEQGDLLFAQSEAMLRLLQFISSLKNCDALKFRSEQSKEAFSRISEALGG